MEETCMSFMIKRNKSGRHMETWGTLLTTTAASDGKSLKISTFLRLLR